MELSVEQVWTADGYYSPLPLVHSALEGRGCILTRLVPLIGLLMREELFHLTCSVRHTGCDSEAVVVVVAGSASCGLWQVVLAVVRRGVR